MEACTNLAQTRDFVQLAMVRWQGSTPLDWRICLPTPLCLHGQKIATAPISIRIYGTVFVMLEMIPRDGDRPKALGEAVPGWLLEDLGGARLFPITQRLAISIVGCIRPGTATHVLKTPAVLPWSLTPRIGTQPSQAIAADCRESMDISNLVIAQASF